MPVNYIFITLLVINYDTLVFLCYFGLLFNKTFFDSMPKFRLDFIRISCYNIIDEIPERFFESI